MQTVIKWPGGKSSEYSIIKGFIPSYDRYVEPFFGGGAVFFKMQPQRAIINDISANLMQFYRYVKEQNLKFKTCLYSINDEWNKLKVLAEEKANNLLPVFVSFREGKTANTEAKQIIDICCDSVINDVARGSKVIINIECFSHEIHRMVNDKFFRTAKNEAKNAINLCFSDLIDNIVTGFLSGYYMYMREVLNMVDKCNDLFIAEEYKSAIFYFVREYCYGSMFRYNKAGEFNIPYGGIGYNKKDFKRKIDLLFSKEIVRYFSETNIFSLDFEKILDIVGEGDFIFLDPPYDTDFSDYENRGFGGTDQRRLASRLHETKAKFLLIINNTPLISELYKNNGYRVYAFDKQYSYCVKGRNDRNAVHLIVTNYDVDKSL